MDISEHTLVVASLMWESAPNHGGIEFFDRPYWEWSWTVEDLAPLDPTELGGES